MVDLKTTEGLALSEMDRADSRVQRLQDLKASLGKQIFLGEADPDRQSGMQPRGVSTGLIEVDRALAHSGFPCGELSFLVGEQGSGVASLWLESARLCTADQRRRVCWVNPKRYQLNPLAAYQRGVQLDRLFLVEPPRDHKQRLWLLKELLESRLFDLIGIDLGDEQLPLREARSWLAHVRRSGAAVVTCFRLSHPSLLGPLREVAHVILQPNRQHIEVLKSAHRRSPVRIQRRPSYDIESLVHTAQPHLGDRIEYLRSGTMG